MATEAKVTAIIEAKDNASKVLDDISNSFSIFNGKVAGIVGAIGVAGGAMVKIANDTASFNEMIARAGANVDATSQQLDEFRQVAIDATRDTNFNATDAAAALYQLAGGTITAQEAMTGLQQAVKFAQANGLDNLDDSVMAVASVMTLFKLNGDDAARAMDVLTTAGHEAYGTTQDLVSAFQEAGPMAAQLGISIEEVSGLLAGLADAGFRGSEAGVAIKRALEQLSAPTGAAADDLAALGIQTADANGQFVGLANALDQLQEKTKDLTPIQRAAELSAIFGQIAGPAMIALLNEGSEARAKYIAHMSDVAGATDKAAAAVSKATNPVQELNNRFFEFETEIAPGVLTVLNGLLPVVDLLANDIRFSFNAAVQNLGQLFYDVEVAAKATASAIRAVGSAYSSSTSFLQGVGARIGSGVSNLLSFDSGGTVPGPVGAPMLAVVHGGEYVVPNGGAGGGISVVITGNSISSQLDIRDLADAVGKEMMRALRGAQQV